MVSTIDDLVYETHLEDIHKSYIDALENFAKSKNLAEMKKNLEHLQGARAELDDLTSNIKGKDLIRLEEALNEVTTLDTIYKTIVEEKKASQITFVSGIAIGIIGVIFAIYCFFT